ncbi:putative Fimbrial assembly protein [uncultured Desulfatiglans sp.]|nr:putative Fimbrial assembly protein [uncultured Desulfatiglans sp.]
MALRTCIGVDIGREKVRMVYLTQSGKKVQVAAHAVYPIGEEIKPGGLHELLREFMRENRIAGTDIYAGVGRDRAFVRFIDLPLAVKENLRETIGYEIEKYIPFPAEEVCFDFEVVAEDREAGQMKVLLAVARLRSIEPLFGDGASSSLLLSGIEPSASALANFCLLGVGSVGRGSAAFLFSGDGDAELNLVEGRRLIYSRAFPAGAGRAGQVQAWVEGLRRLRKEVEGPDGGGLIPVYISAEETAFAALSSDDGLSGFEPRPVDPDGLGLPSRHFIPAYGLALRGLGEGFVKLDLLPPRYRKKASRTGLYVFSVLAVLVVVLAFAWGAGSYHQEKDYLAQLEEAQTQLEADVSRIREITAESEALEARIGYLNSLEQGDTQVLDILRELTRLIPETAWLRRFSYSERSVEIEGYADTASELITLLEDSPIFKDVSFLSGITKSREGKETFRIGLKIG